MPTTQITVETIRRIGNRVLLSASPRPSIVTASAVPSGKPGVIARHENGEGCTPSPLRRPFLGLLAGGVTGLAPQTSGKRKKKKITLQFNGATMNAPKKKKGSYVSQRATLGKCPVTCAPQCTGKICGPDGCDGSCGCCPGDKTCQDGACACPNGTLDCVVNDICVPNGSQCCIDAQCTGMPGLRCLRGQCVARQGTCLAWRQFV